MLTHPIEDRGESDGRKRRADRHGATSDGGIALAQFERIHAEPLAEYIHRLLDGEHTLYPPRAAIGLGVGLVGDHVEALELQIRGLVEGRCRLHQGQRRAPRHAAGVQAKPALDGRDHAVVVGADLELDPRAGGRAAATLQHLLSGEYQLHRTPALLC